MIPRHRQYPRQERPWRLGPQHGLVGPDEDLLHQILRLVVVADHPNDEPPQGRLVPQHQLAEGPRVLPRCPKQRFVRPFVVHPVIVSHHPSPVALHATLDGTAVTRTAVGRRPVPHLPDELPSCGPGYEVLAAVGAGAMGTVYRARAEATGRDVALKLLAPALLDTPDAVERFHREAHLAARLHHPNVVRVLDTVTARLHGRDVPCIVTEFVEGPTLAFHLARSGPLPLAEAAVLVGDLCRALQHAHDLGIVHRDVKPENVLLEGGTVVKVTDFGIARPSERGMTVTKTGQFFGTPAYMAPEAIAGGGGPPSPAVDVYAVGVLLFELLTGRKPFHAPSVSDLLQQHLKDRAPRPSHLTPTIPPAVDAVVTRAMAKRPLDRFPSADALRLALEAALGDEPAPQAPARRRHLVAATLALVGLFAVVWRYATPSPPAAPATVTVRFDAFDRPVLTWTSTEPYAGRLDLRPAAGGPPRTVAERRAGTDHRLSMGGLSPGTYAWTIAVDGGATVADGTLQCRPARVLAGPLVYPSSHRLDVDVVLDRPVSELRLQTDDDGADARTLDFTLARGSGGTYRYSCRYKPDRTLRNHPFRIAASGPDAPQALTFRASTDALPLALSAPRRLVPFNLRCRLAVLDGIAAATGENPALWFRVERQTELTELRETGRRLDVDAVSTRLDRRLYHATSTACVVATTICSDDEPLERAEPPDFDAVDPADNGQHFPSVAVHRGRIVAYARRHPCQDPLRGDDIEDPARRARYVEQAALHLETLRRTSNFVGHDTVLAFSAVDGSPITGEWFGAPLTVDGRTVFSSDGRWCPVDDDHVAVLLHVPQVTGCCLVRLDLRNGATKVLRRFVGDVYGPPTCHDGFVYLRTCSKRSETFTDLRTARRDRLLAVDGTSGASWTFTVPGSLQLAVLHFDEHAHRLALCDTSAAWFLDTATRCERCRSGDTVADDLLDTDRHIDVAAVAQALGRTTKTRPFLVSAPLVFHGPQKAMLVAVAYDVDDALDADGTGPAVQSRIMLFTEIRGVHVEPCLVGLDGFRPTRPLDVKLLGRARHHIVSKPGFCWQSVSHDPTTGLTAMAVTSFVIVVVPAAAPRHDTVFVHDEPHDINSLRLIGSQVFMTTTIGDAKLAAFSPTHLPTTRRLKD